MGNSTTSETTTRTMGTTLTTEQHNNVINGTAVLLDWYHSYPAGVAAKSFYGSLNTKTKGSTLVLRKQIGKVDIDQPAVTEMMARLGATDLYEEFMEAENMAGANIGCCLSTAVLLHATLSNP